MKKIILTLLVASVALSNVFAAKNLKDLAKKALNAASGQTEEKPADVVLTPEIALYSFLKGTGADLTDEYLPYAKVIEGPTYKKYHNDPFEWEEQFSKIKDNFNEKVQSANLDQVYIISTTIEFDDYDFDKQGYTVSIGEATYFPMSSVYTVTDNAIEPGRDSYFGNRLGLKIQDFDKYNFIAMDKNTAKTFLQGRKNSYGNINKKIMILLKYKLAAFDSNEYNTFAAAIAQENKIPLVGIVEGAIEVYDQNDNYKKIGELTIK